MSVRPSFAHHKRNHSWPPFRLHLPHHHAPSSKRSSIDEDPFAFFLSTSASIEDYVLDCMNADIGPASPRRRSLSPNHHRPRKSSDSSPRPHATAAILKLKKWVEKMETRYLRHGRQTSPCASASSAATAPDVEPPEIVLDISELPQPLALSPPLRGRRPVRRSKRSIGDRVVRSHSGRPRAWREPSRDIWPVSEDEEDLEAMMGLGISL